MSSGFYLRGDALDPAEITALLELQPTSSHRKGEVIVSPASKRRGVRKSGFWSIVVHAEGADLNEVVTKAFATVEGLDCDLSSLPNVAEADFDVFGAAEAETVVELDGEFSLSAKQVSRLARLGVSIRVTVAIVPK